MFKASGGAAVEALEARRLFSAELTGQFAVHLPAALPPGGNNRVSVRIANLGNAVAAGPVTVTLYASADPSLDSGDALLGQTAVRVRLRPRASAGVSVGFASPTTLADGNYYLVAQLAAAPGVGLAAGGVFASPITVVVRQPVVDLVTEFVQSPGLPIKTNGIVATPRQATVELVNVGNVAVQGAVNVDLYLTGGDVLSAGAASAASTMRVALRLPPGEGWLVPARLVLPSGTMPGGYRLFAVTTPVRGNALQQKAQADDVAAAAQQVSVVGSVPDAVLAANYQKYHHHCDYYNGDDYCSDDGATFGDSDVVLSGDTVPPGFTPPAPGSPTTAPTTQPTTDPSSGSWDSGLPDATATGANAQNADAGGDDGSTDPGDSGGSTDPGDSGDGGDDGGDDDGGDDGGGDW